MRHFISVLIVLFAVAGTAHAGETKDSVFNCMAKDTLQFNSECVQQNIDANVDYQHRQRQFMTKTVNNSGNVMATMRFYPERHLIEVVAHKDALEKAALLARRD